MDPYCRVRVNHNVYETETAYNGGKNPHWNKTMHIPMNEPIENIYVEILDEVPLFVQLFVVACFIYFLWAVKSTTSLNYFHMQK